MNYDDSLVRFDFTVEQGCRTETKPKKSHVTGAANEISKWIERGENVMEKGFEYG